MPVSKNKRKNGRRESWLGTRVLVCGETICQKPNLVCLLPAGILHRVHVSLALNDEGEVTECFRDDETDEFWTQPALDFRHAKDRGK